MRKRSLWNETCIGDENTLEDFRLHKLKSRSMTGSQLLHETFQKEGQNWFFWVERLLVAESNLILLAPKLYGAIYTGYVHFLKVELGKCTTLKTVHSESDRP